MYLVFVLSISKLKAVTLAPGCCSMYFHLSRETQIGLHGVVKSLPS